MTPQNAVPRRDADNKPWYAHRWPWLLMLGPFLVVLAGFYTAWLAISHQDALVVDDYYKQGKAINQDLRRDRNAASLHMQARLGYDAAAGILRGNIAGPLAARSTGLTLRLVHSTQPEKDLSFKLQADPQGNFSVPLPMLEIARWQVLLENDAREWRLLGTWKWPEDRQITIMADLAPSEPQGR
jgi:hypothetical protein